MRLRLSWNNAYEFACYSPSCRPPSAGGTGGSLSGKVSAASSPHYQERGAGQVPHMSEHDAIALVRKNDATGRRILDKDVHIPEGAVVGVRANLNVKKSTGQTVQTIHDGDPKQLVKGTGMFGGEAIGYRAVATLRDVNFSVNQVARHKIATGQSNKFPMASVDGRMHNVTPSFDGVEIRFNPMRSHLFTDPAGRAIKHADEVTVVGNQVFARGNLTYYMPHDLPKPVGGVASDAHANS